jgi:hypothetical protein
MIRGLGFYRSASKADPHQPQMLEQQRVEQLNKSKFSSYPTSLSIVIFASTFETE